MNKITKSLLIKHIKKCKRIGIRFGFLGFVENKELTKEVEGFFVVTNSDTGYCGYDWVRGNSDLMMLIDSITV